MKFLRFLIGFFLLIYLAYAYLSNTLQYSFYAVIANAFFDIGSFIGNLLHVPPKKPSSINPMAIRTTAA